MRRVLVRRAISSLSGATMAVAAALVVPRPALAQMETREGIALQNQILELQREIQILEQQRGAGGYGGYGAPAPYPPVGGSAATNDLVPRLLARVDALEAAVRELRGRVQELANEQQQMGAQLGKRLDDLQFQIQNPGAGGSAQPARPAAPLPLLPPSNEAPASAGPGGPTTSGPVSPAVARRTPELALQDGDAALARHDDSVAEQDAREVLANRSSPRAYDAQFLLAQALLDQRQYSQAAIAFDDAYNRSRKGPHAQESLLGLSDALIGINEKRAACDTLSKLRSEFPRVRADLRDPVAQNSRRAGCH